jgi:hypothetical protein
MAVTVSRLGRTLPGTRPTYEEPDPNDGASATGGATTPGGISTIVVDTSGGQGGYYSYLSALEKIKADQAAAQAAVNRATQGSQYQANYLTGLLNQGVPTNITNLLGTAETGGKEYIQNQYDLLTKQLLGQYTPETNVGTGYLGAEGRTTAAYNALQNYLRQNQPNAYTEARRQTATPMTSDVLNYLAGQGVSGAPVQSQVDLANLAAQGGAANYNALLNTLQAAQTAAAQSRQAEEQMARSSALSTLQGIYQGQAGGLQQQQLQALAELQANITNQRIAAETAAAARNQTVQDALAALLGTGYINPTQITPTTITGAAPGTTITTSQPTVIPELPAVPLTRAEQVAAAPSQYSTFKDAVRALNPNAVAAYTSDNTGLSAAEVAALKKKFPALAAQYA